MNGSLVDLCTNPPPLSAGCNWLRSLFVFNEAGWMDRTGYFFLSFFFFIFLFFILTQKKIFVELRMNDVIISFMSSVLDAFSLFFFVDFILSSFSLWLGWLLVFCLKIELFWLILMLKTKILIHFDLKNSNFADFSRAKT